MIMKIKNNILFLFLLGLTTVVAQTPKKSATNPSDGIFAEIETSKGKITIALEYQKTPVTVANFISLAEGTNTYVKDEKLKGKPFYDGLKFHRVIADFMIQGGDPAGNGSGGPGYAFKDEIVADLKHNSGGILSMANSGPKTNGSQFFITHKETAWLDGKHTVFGKVTSGMDVVNAIKQDDVITKVTIVRKGADAKKFDAAKIFSNYMANKADEDKKEMELAAENKRKAAELEAKKKAELAAKYAPVMEAKTKQFNELKATATETPSGLKYKIVKNGNGKKPADGTNVLIHYAGYLEDGSLFDSSYEAVVKEYGKFDENRAKANGYQPFAFQYGSKTLIPGFVETIENLTYGDKVVAFIPSKLGYGERGAGNVIPPNSNIIFEIEMIEAPAK
jgi:peptidyl-prolyl cis-trans isomerase A (cyclophilin A)